MSILTNRVLDSRARALEIGDMALVREFDAYLARQGISAPEAAIPYVEERAVPPRPAQMKKGG